MRVRMSGMLSARTYTGGGRLVITEGGEYFSSSSVYRGGVGTADGGVYKSLEFKVNYPL